MLIGELCRRTGVSKGAIRYYESLGLIYSKSRQAGSRNYRDFGDGAVRRIEIIKNGKNFGFKLAQSREILEALVNDKLSTEQRKVILRARVDEIDKQIHDLQIIRQQIAKKIETL